MSEIANTDEVMGRIPATILGDRKESKCCPTCQICYPSHVNECEHCGRRI